MICLTKVFVPHHIEVVILLPTTYHYDNCLFRVKTIYGM